MQTVRYVVLLRTVWLVDGYPHRTNAILGVSAVGSLY